MVRPFRRARRPMAIGAGLATIAVTLAACSSGAKSTSASSSTSGSATTSAPSSNSGSPGAGSSGGSTLPPASGSFNFIGLNTTPTVIADVLKSLSTTACSSANGMMGLKEDSIPQAQLDQKLQLLAAQNALPTLSVAPGTPDLVKQFIKAGDLVDVSKRLAETGQTDEVLPAAASVLESLYGQSDMYALPNEFNIEGIWYNKKIFADNGITSVPTTWDDLMADAAKLKSAGVQPFTADGKDGWDVTRFVGAYLFRDVGPDALKNVADGQAKLTDPAYVKAADAVASMGKNGYFGKAVASTDYNGAINEFLTGKAAMIYMGSWALANFNDPKENQIGADNVGFMKFPAVQGGKGSIDQIPANAGQPLVMAAKGYNAGTQEWLKCIASNYGDQALTQYGVISGFKLHKTHQLDPLTQQVQDQIANAPSSVLWFEALFSAKATTVSQNDGGSLGNGSLSGQAFMQQVQAALGS